VSIDSEKWNGKVLLKMNFFTVMLPFISTGISFPDLKFEISAGIILASCITETEVLNGIEKSLPAVACGYILRRGPCCAYSGVSQGQSPSQCNTSHPRIPRYSNSKAWYQNRRSNTPPYFFFLVRSMILPKNMWLSLSPND